VCELKGEEGRGTEALVDWKGRLQRAFGHLR